MTRLLESTIHKQLKELIERDDFGDEIKGRSVVDSAIESLNSCEYIPSFSLDYLARKKLLNSLKYILPKLNGLDLISSDKSISKERREVLRPDLIAYNAEEKCFVVVEIKKDKQTAREAMTELLAYEHEIQNHMPFCSNLDILFVIVSPEWSTLLDHSITSAVTWSSHNILALNYDVNSSELSVHIPEVWSRLGTPSLPKDSGSTVTLVCYGLSDDEPPPILHNALDLIKDFGNQEKLSGFCYFWRDWHPLSESKWNITICIVNPVEIYKSSCFLDITQRDNPLSTYIENNISDIESYYPSSMFAGIEKGKEYLDRFCDPKYEDLSSWFMDLEENRFRSIPIRFSFFGEISVYTSDLIGNDAFWLMNTELLENSQYDFSNPMMAVPFIDNLFGEGYLKHGVINLVECAKIGKLISIMEIMLHNFLRAHEEPIEKRAYYLCIYRWYQFNLISLVNEIKILMQSVSNTIKELPIIQISDDQEALDSIAALKAWLINDLVGDDYNGHQCMILLSCKIGMLKDKTFEDIVSEADCIDMVISQKEIILKLASGLAELEDTFVDDVTVKESKELMLKIEKVLNGRITKASALELVSDVLEHMPEYLDLVNYPVHFDVLAIDISTMDWQEIRNSYVDHFKSGKKDICVCLQPNGQVYIVQHERAPLLSKDIDAEENFIFLDEKHGVGILRPISWSSIDDGSFFEELRGVESNLDA